MVKGGYVEEINSIMHCMVRNSTNCFSYVFIGFVMTAEAYNSLIAVIFLSYITSIVFVVYTYI